MILKIMQVYIPGFIKKQKLKELFLLTADAFSCDAPEIKHDSFEQGLTTYALFTKEQAEAYLKTGQPLEVVKKRLYLNSLAWGKDLRKLIGVKTWEDAASAMQVIYKMIGIDFHCDNDGNVIINQCFFHQHYSYEVCQIISALDDGVAAGLSDGGSLQFQQRITEGYECCKGRFFKK